MTKQNKSQLCDLLLSMALELENHYKKDNSMRFVYLNQTEIAEFLNINIKEINTFFNDFQIELDKETFATYVRNQ